MVDVTAVLRDPPTIEGLIARARDPRRDRWLEQVRRTGACRQPIRLRGVVRCGDQLVYSTATEPDRTLMVRCRNRREACCPSCAHEYRGDVWQLIYAGVAGGRKGVPESVRTHPQVFVTLTAPSFGAVHTRREDGRPCGCGRHHAAEDAELGTALDLDTYDYAGAVLWNWWAPELWRRFINDLPRVLAAKVGMSERALKAMVRVSFSKVAEFQARGLVHVHAIVRLDGRDGPDAPPGLPVAPAVLCDAIVQSSRRVRYTAQDGLGNDVELRFGRQVHVRPLEHGPDGERLGPEAVAAYVAKYSAKGSHEAITRRRTSIEELRERGVPEQLVLMAAAVFELAQRPGLEQLQRWVGTLGFRGHFMTKSRKFSTTLGALREARAAYRAQAGEEDDVDAATPIVATWEFLGAGYLNPGDVLLAAGVEASVRAGREALLDLRRGPPDAGGEW